MAATDGQTSIAPLETPHAELALLIEQVKRNMMRLIKAALPEKWAVSDFLLLQKLGSRTLTAKMLTEELGVTKGATHATLKTLENNKLVKIEPDRSDKRKKNITATRNALALTNQVLADIQQSLEALTPDMERSHIHNMSRDIRELLNALSSRV